MSDHRERSSLCFERPRCTTTEAKFTLMSLTFRAAEHYRYHEGERRIVLSVEDDDAAYYALKMASKEIEQRFTLVRVCDADGDEALGQSQERR